GLHVSLEGSGNLNRNRIAGVAEFAVGAHIKDVGLEAGQLGFAVMGIGADDQAMANAGLVRGGAVDRDDLRAFLAADGVGGEALAVVDVVDLNLFVLTNAGQVQPVAVDGAGAFVIQHRVGHLGAVQFGLEHDGVHGGVLRVRKRRKVCPNPPACSRLRSSGYQWFTRPLQATYVGIAALEAGSERSFGLLKLRFLACSRYVAQRPVTGGTGRYRLAGCRSGGSCRGTRRPG